MPFVKVEDQEVLSQLGSVEQAIQEKPKPVLDEETLSQLGPVPDLPTKRDDTFYFEQGDASSLWQRAAKHFKNPEEEGARAVQALVDSEAYGISPSQAYHYRDAIDRGIKINPKAAALRSTLTDRVAQSWDVGMKQNQLGEMGYRYVMTGDPGVLEQMDGISMPTEAETFISEGRIEDAVRSAAKLTPMMVEAGLEASGKGLTVGIAFGTIAAIALGPEAAPPAFKAGLMIGGTEGAFESALRKESGLAVYELMQPDAAGNQMDPNLARAVAFGIGSINAGIEVAQIKTLLKTIPGARKLFSKAIIEVVQSQTMKQKLAALGAEYAKTVVKETGQEVAQESVNIVLGELGRQINNEVAGTDFDLATVSEVLDRLAATAKESAQGFAVIALPGIGARAAGAVVPTKEKPPPGITAEEAPGEAAGPDQVSETAKQEDAVVLGVNEDAEGAPESFVMADRETGETFVVPAVKTEEAEVVRYEVDPAEVKAKVEETRAEVEAAAQEVQIEEADIDELLTVPEEELESAVDRVIEKHEQAYEVAPQETVEEIEAEVPVEALVDEAQAPPGAPATRIPEGLLRKEGRPETVKVRVRKITGQVRAPEAMVKEYDALKAAFTKAAQAARVAMRGGNKEGVAKERKRMASLLEKRQQAVKQKGTVNKLRARIKRELKTTRVRKQAGKPAGKFGPEAQEVLDNLRAASKMKKVEAEAKVMANLERYVDEIPPDSVVLENRILSMVARLDEMQDIDALTRLLYDLQELKAEGKMIRGLEVYDRRIRDEKNREDALGVVTGGKGIPENIRMLGEAAYAPRTRMEALLRHLHTIGKSIIGWPDTLDVLSAKDPTSKPFKSKLSEIGDVLKENNAKKKGIREATLEIRQMYMDAYGLDSDYAMLKKMRADSEVVAIGPVTGNGWNQVPLNMSRAQARKRWMELMDPTLWPTFVETQNYNEDVVATIRNFLTQEDMAFVDAQMEFYREYYDGNNEVYSSIYGVNLPFNENYSPIRREGVATTEETGGLGEFAREAVFRASATTAGALKSRVMNIRTIALQGDLTVLEQHVSEMEHFKAWANKIKELNAVFKNSEVRTGIRHYHGKDILAVVDTFLSDMARGGAETAYNIGWLDKFRANFTVSALGIQPDIMVKQLMSFPAYAENMPTSDFIAGVLSFAKNPKKAISVLGSSDMMQSRGINIERDIKTAMRTTAFDSFAKVPSLKNLLLMNVRLGDKGAIYVGGWSMYRHLRKQGRTHEQAIEAFERATELSQQSANTSDQSQWQRGGSFAKLTSMFLSSPNQYMRKELGAIRNLAAGRMSAKQAAKTLFIYHALLPMMFQFVVDRLTWDEDEQLRALILGPLNGIFLIGEGIDYLIRTALGMKPYNLEVPVLSAFRELGKGVRALTEDDISAEDFMVALRSLAVVAGISVGLPIKTAINMTTGAVDVLSGEYEKGISEIVGYTPYQAEKIAK